MGRHQLKNEGESEKYSAAPPAHCGEKISSLPDTDQRVRRGARSSKAGSEPATLPTLEQNGKDQHDAVNNEQGEKKRVKH